MIILIVSTDNPFPSAIYFLTQLKLLYFIFNTVNLRTDLRTISRAKSIQLHHSRHKPVTIRAFSAVPNLFSP